MTYQTSRFTLLSRGTLKMLLASSLLAVPVLVQANTLCEKGLIKLLELKSGGDSVLFVSTMNSPAADALRGVTKDGVRATQMWHGGNATRWANRVTQIRTSGATRQYIEIYSSDDNCMGPVDEFSVGVCNPDGTGCAR